MTDSVPRHFAKPPPRCRQCREVRSRQFVSKVSGGLSTFRQRVADRKKIERLDTFEFCGSGQSFADFFTKVSKRQSHDKADNVQKLGKIEIYKSLKTIVS